MASEPPKHHPHVERVHVLVKNPPEQEANGCKAWPWLKIIIGVLVVMLIIFGALVIKWAVDEVTIPGSLALGIAALIIAICVCIVIAISGNFVRLLKCTYVSTLLIGGAVILVTLLVIVWWCTQKDPTVVVEGCPRQKLSTPLFAFQICIFAFFLPLPYCLYRLAKQLDPHLHIHRVWSYAKQLFTTRPEAPPDSHSVETGSSTSSSASGQEKNVNYDPNWNRSSPQKQNGGKYEVISLDDSSTASIPDPRPDPLHPSAPPRGRKSPKSPSSARSPLTPSPESPSPSPQSPSLEADNEHAARPAAPASTGFELTNQNPSTPQTTP